MRKYFSESEPLVLFSAGLSLNSTGSKTLVFDKLFCNLGEGYNQSSGTFTATVAGTYVFTYFVHGGSPYPMYIYLLHNSQYVECFIVYSYMLCSVVLTARRIVLTLSKVIAYTSNTIELLPCILFYQHDTTTNFTTHYFVGKNFTHVVKMF